MYGYYLYVSPTPVTDKSIVDGILRKYFNTISLDIKKTPEGEYVLTGRPWDYSMCEPNNYDWPQALKWKDLENQMHSDDPDADDALTAELLEEFGDEHFEELLRELAPNIKSPLLIHAVHCAEEDEDPRSMAAQEWYVQPGSRAVEINKFRHIIHDPPYGLPTLTLLGSNKAQVTDHDALRHIFDNYHCTFKVVLVEPSGEEKATLEFRGHSDPRALNRQKYGLGGTAKGDEAILKVALL